MSPQLYSGRPKQQLELKVIFGVAATRAWQDGERDEQVLNRVGRTKAFRFETPEEMNAFILGIEEATGYLDTFFVED